MKKTGIVILTITLIAAICGLFYIVNDKSKRANQNEKVLTEVQRIPTNSLSRQIIRLRQILIWKQNRVI